MKLQFQLTHLPLLILLSWLTKISRSGSINAMQSNYPIRNGIIAIVFTGHTSFLGVQSVNFDLALPSNPSGVSIGISSLQMNNSTSNFIDYSFLVSSHTSTGFQITITLSNNYQISYSKIVISYISSSLAKIATYSVYPNNTYTNQNTTNQSCWKVRFNQPIVNNTNVGQSTGIYLIPVLSINIPSKIFSYRFQFGYVSGQITQVSACFVKVAIVTSIKIGGIFFLRNDTGINSAKYKFKVDWASIPQNSQSEVMNVEQYSPIRLFLALTSIDSTVTNKVDFNLQYSPNLFPEYLESYLANNLIKELNRMQASNPTIGYEIAAITNTRQNCPATYPYLDYQVQICYDTIPITKYVDSNSRLVSCFRCTNTQVCSFCYSNACLDDYFFTNTTSPFSCISCSTLTSCTSCIANLTGVFCVQCDSNSNSQLINGSCIGCNSTSYLNPNDQCTSCSSAFSNCSSCAYVSSILKCTGCEISSQTELINGSCRTCTSTFFFQVTARRCDPCSMYCLSCTSPQNCSQCNTSVPNIKLQSDRCIIEVVDVPHQNQTIEEQVNSCGIIFKLNSESNRCVASYFSQKISNVLINIASIPTLSIFTNSFISLFGTLDDLSYYNYHMRNYSYNVEIYLQFMNNFTLARFFPSFLVEIFNNLDYSEKILKNDFQRSPQKFEKIDGSVYFLKVTNTIWTSMLILTFLMFLICNVLNILINKMMKTNLFKPYRYVGMIIVSFLGCNIQYFSFRAFSQLFITVPQDYNYNFNLLFTYLILFTIVIYSLSSALIFKSLYSSVQNRVFQNSFQSRNPLCFAAFNILKLLTGFIHAYFYYDPFVQSILLTFAYFFKLVVYYFQRQYSKNLFDYCFNVFTSFLIFALQSLFLFYGLFMEDMGIDCQNYVGILEIQIIILMIFIGVLQVLVEVIKISWQVIKKRTRSYKQNGQNQKKKSLNFEILSLKKANKAEIKQINNKMQNKFKKQKRNKNKKLVTFVNQDQVVMISEHLVSKNKQQKKGVKKKNILYKSSCNIDDAVYSQQTKLQYNPVFEKGSDIQRWLREYRLKSKKKLKFCDNIKQTQKRRSVL